MKSGLVEQLISRTLPWWYVFVTPPLRPTLRPIRRPPPLPEPLGVLQSIV